MVHLSFCRARAECTRCFRFLVDDKEVGGGFGGTVSGSGSGGLGDGMEMGREDTTLFCLSGCHIRHAAIKWYVTIANKPALIALCTHAPQLPTKHLTPLTHTPLPLQQLCINHIPTPTTKRECSGPVSDSTGQAKLYSERTASLALVGHGLDVRAVEHAAWHHPSGVTYARSVPPKSNMDTHFFEAQKVLAKRRTARREEGEEEEGEITDEDILRVLPIRVRAEYELERFCRNSHEPLRKVDVFVRCKPLASPLSSSSTEGGGFVDRVEVPVVSVRGDEGGYASLKRPTFCLPLLRLSLVQCFQCRGRARDLGWDMVRALRSNPV